MTSIAFLAPFFPYDPALDSAMGHSHLLLGYGFTWGIQLAYLLYIGWKWQAQRRSNPQSRSSPDRSK